MREKFICKHCGTSLLDGDAIVDSARRAMILMASGRWVQLSFCEDCTEFDVSMVYRKMVAAQIEEQHQANALNIKRGVLPPDQVAREDVVREKHLLSLVNDCFLGILCWENWSDLKHDVIK